MGSTLVCGYWVVVIAARIVLKRKYVFQEAPEWVLDRLIDTLVEQRAWYWVNQVREELEWRIYKEGLLS